MSSEPALLAPFLNRAEDFNPGEWFHLVPKGRFPVSRKIGDRVERVVQVVDDRSVEQIIANFNRRKTAAPDFRMLVDFEHFSHDPSKSSAAACWVTDVELRANGIWAKGEWSDDGAAAIRNRRYRYLSPVWFPNQTERISASEVRPLEINDAGLTNKPNMGDALTPFWNRAEEISPGREATNQPKHAMKEQLIALLGLAATATDAEVIAGVQAFKNRASLADTLTTQLATEKSEHSALKNRHTELLGSSAERVLADNADVIPEGGKAAWKNRLEADFAGTSELLKGLKRPEGKAPLHKAGAGAAAAAKKAASAVETDGQSAFLNRVQEVQTARKIDRADAMAAVATEEPELYAAYREDITTRE